MYIRSVTAADAEALVGIYAHYVRETAITFDTDVPSVSEFENKIRHITGFYPFIAAVDGDEILGYAYADVFRSKAAFAWSVEMTIYVRRGCHRRGVGTALYLRLEELLKEQNITNLYACITYPNPESIAFHEKLGYSYIGRFEKCGYKLGQWQDVVWLGKVIGEHREVPEGVTAAK